MLHWCLTSIPSERYTEGAVFFYKEMSAFGFPGTVRAATFARRFFPTLQPIEAVSAKVPLEISPHDRKHGNRYSQRPRKLAGRTEGVQTVAAGGEHGCVAQPD